MNGYALHVRFCSRCKPGAPDCPTGERMYREVLEGFGDSKTPAPKRLDDFDEFGELAAIVAQIAIDPPGEEGSGHCHFCCSGGEGPGETIDGKWHSEECVYLRAVRWRRRHVTS